MKKRNLVMFLFILLILNTILITASDQPPMPPAMPNIPVIGNINPDTGQPQIIDQLTNLTSNLSKDQIERAYLQGEWRKMLLKNEIAGPIIINTENFLISLNPIWKIVLGVEFSWTFLFMFALFIWIFFIIFFYSPLKSLTNINPILTFIASVLVSSIIGTTGKIKDAATFLDFAFSNIWIAWLSIVIGIFVLIFYYMIIKYFGGKLKKEQKQEELERSEETIKAHGEVSSQALKDLGRNPWRIS